MVIIFAFCLALFLLIYGNGFRGGRYVSVILFSYLTRLAIIFIDEDLGLFTTLAVGEYLPYILRFYYLSDNNLFVWFDEIRVQYYVQLYPGWLFTLFGMDSIVMTRIANAFIFTAALGPLVVIYETLLKIRPPKEMLWVVFLWPTALRYSVEFGRSSPVFFFVLLSIATFLLLIDSRTRVSFTLLIAFAFSSYSTFMLRPAHIVYLLPIASYFLWAKFLSGRMKSEERFLKLCVISVLLFSFLMPMVLIYNETATAGQVADFDVISHRAETDDRGATAYLVGIAPSTPLDLLWYAPLHGFYFLFSPFPWNVLTATNPLAWGSMFQAMLLFVYFVYLWRKRKQFTSQISKLKPIFLILFFAAATLGSGVKNAGSAERWRLPLTALSILVVYATVRGDNVQWSGSRNARKVGVG